jgi:putative Mn2+ efflux pump MntP
MDTAALLILALGLSMDAFAISVARGLCYTHNTGKNIVATAAAFGLAQAVMPVIGFAAGKGMLSALISRFDHWIAFAVLSLMGVRMLRCPQKCEAAQGGLGTLTAQAVATSIDALAVGVGLTGLLHHIWPGAATIGAVTFVCCLAGGSIGIRFGVHLERYAGFIGGGLLLILGVRFLLGG